MQTFLHPVLQQHICAARDQRFAFIQPGFHTTDFYTTGKCLVIKKSSFTGGLLFHFIHADFHTSDVSYNRSLLYVTRRNDVFLIHWKQNSNFTFSLLIKQVFILKIEFYFTNDNDNFKQSFRIPNAETCRKYHEITYQPSNITNTYI